MSQSIGQLLGWVGGSDNWTIIDVQDAVVRLFALRSFAARPIFDACLLIVHNLLLFEHNGTYPSIDTSGSRR